MTARFSSQRSRDGIELIPLLALLLWAGGLLLLQSPQQSLMAHDEGYYAQQARWILLNQDWITVGWWDQVLFDRTIGLQWLMAVSYRIFGISEWAARLPVAISSLAAVLLTWRLGRRWTIAPVGWWAAAILAVTPIWAQASRLGTQDVPLVAAELLGIWALLRSEDSGNRAWGLVAGLAVGLGFMLKSVMLVLVVIALLPYLVQRWRTHLANPWLYAGLGLGFGPVVAWLGLSVQRYGWLPVQQLFGKVLTLSAAEGTSFDTATSPFYYLWNIPANTFPWALLAVAGFIVALRSPILTRKWLWLGYPAILLLELTLFDTRTWYYPLQLYPFLALLAALALTVLTQNYASTVPWRRRLPLLLSWLLGIVAVVLLVVGAALLTAPWWGGNPQLQGYGWIGLAGLGWLVPWATMQADSQSSRWQRRGRRWQLGWLLGPWVAIATLFLSGLWGNYSADVKTALGGDLAEVLSQQPVHFLQPDASPPAILLTFYTPQLGDRVGDWAELPAGSYGWAPPGPVPSGYTVLASVRDWQLVQAP